MGCRQGGDGRAEIYQKEIARDAMTDGLSDGFRGSLREDR
jgi:hypothetical protein